jgi:FeS assembly protein IscX
MQIYIARNTVGFSNWTKKREYNKTEMLTWDDSYAIALALRDQYPDAELEEVSLYVIYRWTVALPEFDDDPALANDEILAAIVQEWLEEANPL